MYSKDFQIIKLLLCLSSLIIFFNLGAVAQTLDPNFFPVIGSLGVVNVTRVQPDGKLLYGSSGLTRSLSDGRPDSTWTGFSLGGTNPLVHDTQIQEDGKILVGGRFQFVNGNRREGLVRLNTDGTPDANYFPWLNNFDAEVKTLALQPDNKLLVGGRSLGINHLIRFNSDGLIDSTFQNSLPSGVSEVSMIGLQDDGKFIVSYQIFEGQWKSKIARYHSNGTPDVSFLTLEVLGTGASSDGSPDIDAMHILPDGKILIGGSFTSLGGTPTKYLARINSNGAIDPTFNTSLDGAVFSFARQGDGKIVLSGLFAVVNGVAHNRIARITAEGVLDPDFDITISNNVDIINSLSIQSDGRIFIAGRFYKINNTMRYGVARVNATGSIDTSFVFVFVGSGGNVTQIAPRADGKIFIGGQYASVNGEMRRRITLLNRDGTVDNSFPDVLFGASNTSASAILPSIDNKVFIGGDFGGRLWLFDPIGDFDSSYISPFTSQNSSSVSTVVKQPDGKILVGGNFTLNGTFRNNIARLNIDGSIDDTFLNNLVGTNLRVRKIILQEDGKILIAGLFTQVNGFVRNRVARLHADGSLDQTFQDGMIGLNNTTNNSEVVDMEIQSDGKLIVAGDFETVNGIARKYLTRLNVDGSIDNNFLAGMNGPDGGAVRALTKSKAGKILIGGSFTSVNGQMRSGLAQLNSEGELDASFNISLITPNSGGVYELALEPSGNLLVGISSSTRIVNGVVRAGMFRLLMPQNSGFDFDGDGKADISVFRPSNFNWYVQGTAGGFTVRQFGAADDKMAPADYDGDGKTDIAVFRPSTGTWYKINSATNTFSVSQFGADGDLTIPGDFDADGKADLAVFRPSNGNWYRVNSGLNTYVVNQFGTAEDKPVRGDFDGDGKTDLAVFRPSNGTWYMQKSSGSYAVRQFGENGDIPVAADYDGDGTTDLAVFRPSTGTWYVLKSSGVYFVYNWGEAGDKPVAADYDGDGKADIAVFRPSNGTWYRIGSLTGISVQAFGADGDLPTPNAFVY